MRPLLQDGYSPWETACNQLGLLQGQVAKAGLVDDGEKKFIFLLFFYLHNLF